MYCTCHGILPVKVAVSHLVDEMLELARTPNRSELSDVAYSINRLAGALLKREVVGILPATNHVAKINLRMSTYGCIRSRSHRSCYTERSQ